MREAGSPACSSGPAVRPNIVKPVSEALRVLVIEESPLISEALQPYAHIQQYRPLTLNTARTSQVISNIKQCVYNMIWIYAPSRRLIRQERWTAHLRTLTEWLHVASKTPTLYFVIGVLNNLWGEPEVVEMMNNTEGNMKYYSLC